MDLKRAHEHQPDNWGYKRQAWQYVSPMLQDARAVYGTGRADEVEKFGAENYYRAQDLSDSRSRSVGER